MNRNKSVGQYGEGLARGYLEDKGYKIVELNAKASYKEIDIIALKNKVLVFVEVKTRTSTVFGEAEDAINGKKLKNLKQAIGMYLRENKNKYEDIRLDFIAVDIDKVRKTAKIKHYEDII